MKLYTIASSRKHIAEQFKLESELAYNRLYQATPGSTAPIVINSGGAISSTLGAWETSNIPFVAIRKVLQSPHLNHQIRRAKCAILANCFFIENAGKSYLVRVLKHRLFCMAGLLDTYSEGAAPEYTFRVLTAPSSDVIAHLTDTMPILLAPDKVTEWLETSSLHEIIGFADGANDHWLDYFEVSESIQWQDQNDKDLLRPLGLSNEEIKARERQMMALKIKKDRTDRGSSKR